ncbi:hypothetical protein EDD18DRAFT_31473 [Armillaria luteobubalina]|uniref:Heterokaryon incompatibility domain-containing protein n=1 Tax=Armillaria luteobubalina TaxID=153913 RepID=A0AA39V5F4_9AGAR|nr:hypothetical protein EDD18DRAFT_31473 [Armillaria luteobubalina]
MQPHLEPQQLEHTMYTTSSRQPSLWSSVKQECRSQARLYRWMSEELRLNLVQTVNPEFPKVTISSQTETRQTEEFVKVPKQRAYTGRKPVISSYIANIPCSGLGIQGLLDLLNTTLRTSYTLDTPYLSSVLKDCIAHGYDFGTAYGRLRKTWRNHLTDFQMELQEREREDIDVRRNTLKGSRIVDPRIQPRRVWDLCSNRVVPWWCCEVTFRVHYYMHDMRARCPISHAWVDEVDRVDVWTPINGREWPVPIPKGANLDLIRIEMLNLGVEYTWLDVLCLRQRGGPREDLRVEEWKLDVPTIGAIYQDAYVVCYLSGLGLPFTLKEGDLESDRCWFRRAWTAQEVGQFRRIAGDTPDGPLHAKPIDDMENYEDKILMKFHGRLFHLQWSHGMYDTLSAMQDRISTNPVDKVAGLAYSLETVAIPAYYESQSLEDAWIALIYELHPYLRGTLLFTFPEPGTGCKKWRPSWEQVMEKSLPPYCDGRVSESFVWRDDDDWYEGPCIERGFVRGLAVGGEEGIDRCGELVVEDADGISHAFRITAPHQYPIPEDTYTLLGSGPLPQGIRIDPYQSWAVGRRLPNKMFEKVSVFKMNSKQAGRLKKLDLFANSHSYLA